MLEVKIEMKLIFDMNDLYEEILTPDKFLSLGEKDKLNISYSEIIPARLGESTLGRIRVHYKTPRYIKIKHK